MRGEVIPAVQESCNSVNLFSKLYQQAAIGLKKHKHLEIPRWRPPPDGFRKINFDAAHDHMQAFGGL